MSALGKMVSADVALSPSQERAVARCLELARAGNPAAVHVTGPAGTGKSTVLRNLRERTSCVVLAPTGLAAVNVGGETIHRFFGFPMGPLTRGRVNALDERKRNVLQWARLIIVDESSMARADLVDGIDAAMQKTLGNSEPFGGKPVAFFGDDMQLEPVVTPQDREFMDHKYRSPYWFDSQVLGGSKGLFEGAAAQVERIELQEVFRQTGDPDFLDALNATRVGDPSGLFYLNTRAGLPLPAGEPPVSLCFTNARADLINRSRMAALESDSRTYEADVEGEFGARDVPVPESLQLKVGAQVMFVRNVLIDGWESVCNGAVGEVLAVGESGPTVALRDGRIVVASPIDWEKRRYSFDLVKDEVKQVVDGRFTQVPLRPAWACTVHKAQGATLDSVCLELEMVAFAAGLSYVAVSRTRRFEDLYLRRKLSSRDLIVSDRVREFHGIPIGGARRVLDLEAI